MKFLKTGAMAALLSVCCLEALAQTTPPLNEPDYNKPKIFSDLPERLNLRTANAEALLSLPVGAQINVQLATGFTLAGTVTSVSNPADATVKSVVIKSTNRQGAAFTFTRISKADGSYTYAGRMLSNSAGDALEISKDDSGYFIRKKALYDFIAE